MNWLTKKATSSLFIKKKTVLFVLFFIFLGIFFPIKTAFAYWYDFLIGAITFLPMVAIALILTLGVGVSALLAAFGGVVLNWVLSPGFMDWSYTNPGGPNANPIIKIGLDITQPFVNMILVLVLVFIALATILRLAGYETKKLLPAFIIIALLVNFAPVICGLIIDASNIVMNYFTKEITGGQQLISMLKTVGDTLVGAEGVDWEIFKATKQIEAVLTLVVLIAVNLVLFLLLELFALVFMARYMVIWLLVILSPLAFVCYILPATRKIWDLWWKQFIQWSVIGITMGFFLYLADQFMTKIPTIPSEFNKGLGGAVLPALFPLIFLALGFVFGLQTGAMGASTVMSFGKSVPGRIARTRIGAKTSGGAASGAAKGLGKVGSFLSRMEEKAGKVRVVGKLLKPMAGVALGGYMTRGIGRLAGPALLKYAAKTKRVQKADLDDINGMSGTEAEAYTKQKAIFGTDRLQYMARMAENEVLEYTSSDFQKEAKAERASTFTKENPYFQKEAHTLRKALGDMGEEELIHSKLVGLTDKTKRDEKEKEIREEIKKTGEIIQERLGHEGITIEAGLKLKYITKEEVDKDKVKAVTTAKAKLTAEEMTKFLTNTVAAATDVKELKPEDIKKMIDPDTLATRIGLTLGNPRNLQRIQDSFGHKKLKSVIEGRGGLNDATNTPEKLDKFARDINPALVQAIFTSPAYREIDIEARKHMLDAAGRPTEHYANFKERLATLPKPPTPKIVTPGTKEYIETEEELKKRPPTRGRGGVGV